MTSFELCIIVLLAIFVFILYLILLQLKEIGEHINGVSGCILEHKRIMSDFHYNYFNFHIKKPDSSFRPTMEDFAKAKAKGMQNDVKG